MNMFTYFIQAALCTSFIVSCFGAAGPALPTPGTTVIKHNVALLECEDPFILGCDAGRFEVRVGIFAVDQNRPKLAIEYRTPTQELTELSGDRFGRFALYLNAVLNDVKKDSPISITHACIGAPGNTSANRDLIDFIHAPFGISAEEIRKYTCLESIFVVNDFEVIGLGIEAIDPMQIITILPGIPRVHGTKLIIGAGNGLGSGLMLWNDTLKNYMPSPLSYSLMGFSPQSELELKYNEYLKRTSNNAWGKVLGSSAGIVEIYRFLHETETLPCQHAAYQEIFDKRETDSACKAAVEMYMKLYIRLMHDAALVQTPYAGLYITNDIAVKNPSLFTDASFAAEFLNTGDLTNPGNKYLYDCIQQIPVYLVPSLDLKLYGAAQYAVIESRK